MQPIDLGAEARASIATKQGFADHCLPDVERLCELATEVLRGGGKLLLCGNGGSACDAAHAAGELVGWFLDKDRPAIAAIALGHEVPALTAIGNDAGYEHVFARQLQALGRPGDLLIGITTSGGSKNVIAALELAASTGVRTAVLCGERGGRAAELAEIAVRVPSTSTPRIQECHLLVVHLLCGWLEHALRRA